MMVMWWSTPHVERTGKIGVCERRALRDDLLQQLERVSTLRGPLLRDVVLEADGVERRGNGRDLGNKVAQVVDESQEALQLLGRSRNRPVHQVGQARRIDRSTVRV